MTTKPSLSYAQSDENIVQQLLTQPLNATADIIELADISAAFVCVLIETTERDTRMALCTRLLQTLGKIREGYDTALPPHLAARLIEGESMSTCVPACWQETAIQVDYAQALTQAIMGNTLAASVEKELTGLLHDMVWLLAEFVKEPSITAH